MIFSLFTILISPHAQSSNCASLVAKFFNRDSTPIPKMKLSERLLEVETLARSQGVSFLDGLSEARVLNPLKRRKIHSLTNKLHKKGLSPKEIDDLVELSYQIANPKRFYNFRNITRDEILHHAKTSILKKNIAQSLSDKGLVRDMNAFRSFMFERRAYLDVFWSALWSGLFLRDGNPVVLLPKLRFSQMKALPDSIHRIILDQGIDAAYPTLRAHYGKHAQFEAIWNRFRNYAQFAIFTGAGFYMHQKMQKDAEEAFLSDLDALLSGNESNDLEQRIETQIQEFIEQHIEEYGHPPDAEEVEALRLILRFHGN